MPDTVIKVENLSKSYQIRHQTGERYTALRDVLTNGVKGMGNRLRGRTASASSATDASREEFWALNDVSFEIKQGERVGIIGRNGAGKSTLLKILSRITEPTKGRIHIKGRVASLLEVGTGFHPELTGRENIYLNGAILGMSREEIRRKFDEIVAFAEVEKFLDTPVKRYSSGMYVRLAFAVAAHLEPEILVVDEVLAVGDAAFQKKCLGKMSKADNERRTVLFVSHNMGAISELCEKVLLIQSGTIVRTGSPAEAISDYLETSSTNNPTKLRLLEDIDTNILSPKFTSVETRNRNAELSSNYLFGEQIIVRITLWTAKEQKIVIGVGIRDTLGRQILHFNSRNTDVDLELFKGTSTFELRFENILNNGDYFLTLWAGDSLLRSCDYVQDCMKFTVDNSSIGSSLEKGMVISPGNWMSI